MMANGSILIGAQYYRPSNPLRSDWERDLALMAESGMNTVKFWACWSWMNPERGCFDFADLDAPMEIASRAGLKVVLNVILEDAPYWLEEDYPEARYRDAEGRDIQLGAAMNTPGGGWPGLCFDNTAVLEAGLAFLEAVVARYMTHAALLSWDVWNEPHLEPASYFPERLYCYCTASVSKFRYWLHLRYKTIDALNERWARRFSSWSQVHPPRLFEAAPDMMDWREFWFGNLRAWLDARVARVKALGATQPAMTHVALSGFTGQLATHTLDEWTLAPAADGFGTSSFPTWLMNDDPVEHLMSLDAARAAAPGKPFWQTELQGGRGRRAGAASAQHPRPEVLTLEMWNALAAGARGILFWQWRPDLLGPESPGYGLCAVDGSPTQRSRAVADFATMARRVPELSLSTPAPAAIGLGVSRRTAFHAFATDRTMDIYRRSVMGAYRLLVDADLPVEFVHEDEIERLGLPSHLRAIYHPTPTVISETLAARLAAWVHAGGWLLSEAAPGPYDERGWHRSEAMPAIFHRLFGAHGIETDAAPGEIAFTIGCSRMKGAWIRDAIEVAGANAIGYFDDGKVAATSHRFGSGEAVLIATCPSVAYDSSRDSSTRDAMTSLFPSRRSGLAHWGNPSPGLMLRLHVLPDGAGMAFALNWSDRPQALDIDSPVEFHDIALSRVIPAHTRWKMPPFSGALLRAF
jgi:beta-galactosidase GanA